MRHMLCTVLALCLASCGGLSAEDRASLNAQIRAEVRAEMARVELERRQEEGSLGGGATTGAEQGGEPEDAVAIEPEDPPQEVERIRMPAVGPSRGADAPLVTIVTFSDFQCPFCARVEPTMTRLLNAYPDEVRLVFRNNPLAFHNDAGPAAEAALEAQAQQGDPGFWAMHALLFENQRQLTRADLDNYAARIGLDMARFNRAMTEGTHRSQIAADQAESSRAGARGTPAFFLNGRQLMGAQPYERFDEIVQQEIRAARALVRQGVPRGELYARFMRNARSGPAPEPEAAAPTLPSRPQPDPSAVYRIPLDGRPSVGSSRAPVTIVAFLDFQCPFCSRVMPTLEQVRTQYGRDVRLVVRNNPLPFHDRAMPAAEVGLEVFAQRGADAYFRYVDLVFENQRDLTRENLIQFARQAGARSSRVERALESGRHRADITADQELARSLGASGTPSFFINGRNLRGAQPLAAFTALIDEVREDAQERIRNGTPARRVYQTIIRDGHTTPQLILPEAAAPADPTRAAAAGADRVYAIAVPAQAPSRGPASAPVTIQLFSDFQCPFCSHIRPTLDQVRERYGDQVRIVWRDYPLPSHDNARAAARAAREVFRQGGDRAFWDFHDRLFENQRQLNTDTMVRLAGEVRGIDALAVRGVLESDRYDAEVQADMDAVITAGARIGTPSSFINGRLLQGAQPFPAFEAAINRALRDAD
ncbi:MAG: DsbA family protein [Sandaracinaceae bacterium]